MKLVCGMPTGDHKDKQSKKYLSVYRKIAWGLSCTKRLLNNGSTFQVFSLARELLRKATGPSWNKIQYGNIRIFVTSEISQKQRQVLVVIVMLVETCPYVHKNCRCIELLSDFLRHKSLQYIPTECALYFVILSKGDLCV